MRPRIVELHRVLAPTGSLYLHCDQHAKHYLGILLDEVFGMDNRRNEIIWKRTSSHNAVNKWASVCDTILAYGKDDTLAWALGIPVAGFPDSVWTDIPPLNAQSKERLGWPTQKPEALLERIVRAGSNPGDVVLDPFVGCGTSVAVAQKLCRQWIGIDQSEAACALTGRRLAQVQLTMAA